MTEEGRPRAVTVIAVVNGVAGIVTFLFWALVYARLFRGAPIEDPAIRASASGTLGFLVGDLVWAVPLLFAAAAGVRRLRVWGRDAALMANVLWVYSMTVIWVRDLHAGSVSPGALLFTPFAIFAVWATAYLWKKRNLFAA
ncbi:MAG: hypothetical protein JW958_01535 [Candidatus Eisenbacteria bacterium]|nr:hypothetical protein [Candidatus Eisenbacteria bacterium]